MIVTLAGHVDHGKTSLVKALTGVDTDLLAEERRRGLTIDLGFAYQRRDGGGVLGFVDVPGHHRFIHNMVAGVAAMQHALLVVDAGDGPMPQTREHLQILSLSGLSQGSVALTKCDQVQEDRVQAAESAVRSLLGGTFLEGGRIFRTSATTGAGLGELRQALWSAADRLAANAMAARGQFRLAVDRAFNVQGTGLVVTGTVHAGRVARDDALHVFPGGERVRVRGLRVQDGPAQSAVAGDRTALNLAGIGLDRVGRGRWLTQAPMPERRNFVIELQVLKDLPRPVRHWLPVHVYHATSHSTARLALLNAGKALPGERQEAEIVTDEPLCARHGDHLVLRDQGLYLTLGGGRVLCDLPPSPLRRRDPARLAPVNAFKHRRRQDLIAALLNQGPVSLPPLQNTLGLTDGELAAALSAFELVRLDGEAVLSKQWAQWRREALEFVRRHGMENPTAPGVPLNLLPASIPRRMAQAVLNELVAEGGLARTGGVYHLPSHIAAIPKEEQALFDRLRPCLDRDQSPSLGDLAKEQGLPINKLQAGLGALARRGLLVQVSAKRFYLPERLRAIAKQVAALAEQEPLSVRRFRDQTGIGRNIAIELLEFFDGQGFTKRAGDARMVVGELKLY